MAVGAGLIGVAVATMAAWVVIAGLTAPHQQFTIDDALEALDKGELEYASDLVARLQSSGQIEPQDIGGPLFVLGALRVEKAQQEFSPEHRRRGYLIASRFLSSAREAGFPPGREHQGLYLLGKSLIKSNQLKRGVAVLGDALLADPEHVEDIHRLIAEAQFYSESPVYGLVLKHLDQALSTAELREPERSDALILKSLTLAKIGRFEDALSTLALAEPEGGEIRKLLVEGQVRTEEIRHLAAQPEPPQEVIGPLIGKASEVLARAMREDSLATGGGSAKYFLGQLYEVMGKPDEALGLLEDVLKSYGQEPEGVAAAIAEAQIMQSQGEDEQAIKKFRIALDSVTDPVNYRSELLPLADLRKHVLAAQSLFVAQQKFHAAVELIDRLYPVFSRNRQLELRADVFKTWGESLLHQADADLWASDDLRREGRAKLREAGTNFELLADGQFASKHYPDYLWQAADTYFLGQNYHSALRVLRKYLKQEPELRNALALLRLGQTRLALKQPRAALEALEECIEFHPQDASTYRARLECAKAYREIQEHEKAKVLLEENLLGSTLSPQSPEWRDSKFELGRLLHEHQEFDAAIRTLEEAILRYPGDRQTRLAKYMVAESYRQRADAPLEQYELARTVNERERNLAEVMKYLNAAMGYYKSVQQEIAEQASWSSLDRAMIRNCYMFKGSVLYQQGVLELDEAERAHNEKRSEEENEEEKKHRQAAQQHLAAAVQAYSDLSAQFQDEPIILEALVQIAHCWRRLDDVAKARGQIARAVGLLEQLPRDTDFATTTNLSRNEWEAMLNEMQTW
ncbi:MAG: tetratricopeptide repeat protein [Planctomycetales bacterium]|nr:tetratricopeptide repeat protein [Planctomycetales bacterium]